MYHKKVLYIVALKLYNTYLSLHSKKSNFAYQEAINFPETRPFFNLIN